MLCSKENCLFYVSVLAGFCRFSSAVKMADKNKCEAWKNFTKVMKERCCGTKGTKAKKGKGQESSREELTIQRLSAEVHGKAQKYSHVGPREFFFQPRNDG